MINKGINKDKDYLIISLAWKNDLIMHLKTWLDVPAMHKGIVMSLLRKDVKNGDISVELYKEITGENCYITK